MAKSPLTVEPHVERPGPAEFRDPFVRRELAKAAVWLGMALAIAGVIVLGQPLLLIIGGAIFAVLLDGGVRLLGRVLPIARGWRLLLVLLLGFGFLGWVIYFAGTTIGAQFETLRAVVTQQFNRLMEFAGSLGLIPKGPPTDLGSQLLGSVGRLTTAVGSVLGAVASAIAMLVIGIFIAAEPRIYDRGIAWMLPLRARAGFYRIAEHVGFTLRRLLFGRLVGMVFEGVFTWIMLTLGGVPMAALLGLVTGVLAFIPNIGAITSGLLMVAVGFSAGTHQGIYAIVVYFLVQNIDGYLVLPYIARKTVDLPPALVLAMQLLMGALFGILGLLFADPILATLKVVLVDLSKQQAEREDHDSAVVDPAREPIAGAAPADPAPAVPASAASSRRRRGRSSGPERRT
ncbi:AI-2E family transporter [Sphingomonas flavescens]|uniref:AI-2E family transporter n=1 Tax=Sphingomonas flavescens TaxID=3132797 RepID=UPI0028040888|nr:AI-2E family transporter [Sphingomonas limnosediminicola]